MVDMKSVQNNAKEQRTMELSVMLRLEVMLEGNAVDRAAALVLLHAYLDHLRAVSVVLEAANLPH